MYVSFECNTYVTFKQTFMCHLNAKFMQHLIEFFFASDLLKKAYKYDFHQIYSNKMMFLLQKHIN